MATVPHLVQYQGSKRNLAASILRYMPPHFNRLIEPFSGTAAITMACAYYRRADKYIINDINKPLLELLRLTVEAPDYVSERYHDVWKEQETSDTLTHFYLIRDEFNKSQDPILFLYLLARCVKGAVRYNSEGQFNQSPDKRRRGTSPKAMAKNVVGISRILKGKAEFYSKDYKEILELAQPGDVVYMDPPYQGVCATRDSRYFSGIDHNEFVEQLDILNQRGINYLVSYDGMLGDKTYGEPMPASLELQHVYLNAGRSTQATLLGGTDLTKESLYISKGLAKDICEPTQLELVI